MNDGRAADFDRALQNTVVTSSLCAETRLIVIARVHPEGGYIFCVSVSLLKFNVASLV